MNEVEERILSTLRPHPPTPPNPAAGKRELRDELWQEALEGAQRSRMAMAARA